MISFLDTSALLNDYILGTTDKVSSLVLFELQNIKNSKEKDDHIKYKVRSLMHQLLENPKAILPPMSQREIEKWLKKHSQIVANNDGKLIAEACLLNRNENVIFYTSDMSCWAMANSVKDELFSIQFISNDKKEIEYNGWSKCYPNIEQFNMLYSDPKINALHAETNEYCKIFQDTELKDIMRWDGSQYQHLKYKDIVFQGEHIRPLNIEQKCWFDLLQNKDIPIKMAAGIFGSGKTFIALTYALSQLQLGRFDKIVYVFNHIQVQGTKDIGALPNSLNEKLSPWLAPIADILGGFDELDMYLKTGQIEALPLALCRGRNLENCCVIADEVENFSSKKNFQLLIGRIAKGSELILLGDARQTDVKHKEKMMGINAVVKALKGHPKFGYVKLIKTERSEVAAMADLLDEI